MKNEALLEEMGLLDVDPVQTQVRLDDLRDEIAALETEISDKRQELSKLETKLIKERSIMSTATKSSKKSKSSARNTVFKGFTTNRTDRYIRALREETGKPGRKRYGFYDGEEDGVKIIRKNLSKSTSDIADILNEEGIPTRMGGEWTADSVRTVIRNTFVG